MKRRFLHASAVLITACIFGSIALRASRERTVRLIVPDDFRGRIQVEASPDIHRTEPGSDLEIRVGKDGVAMVRSTTFMHEWTSYQCITTSGRQLRRHPRSRDELGLFGPSNGAFFIGTEAEAASHGFYY